MLPSLSYFILRMRTANGIKNWQTSDQNAVSMQKIGNTIALGYNNLGLCNVLFIILHILWYKLKQPRETLKRETSKQGIWPINKQELITKHFKQFMKFTNSIDFDKL